ncbi:MAG: RluA family pseudouridine synthase [Acidobacteria bacterium]|nr:RluA family pseudouridine synthase [Acidobacteriota bacterium]
MRWTVRASEAGLRLDKFLAHPDRLASRGKAAAALERGKVFVNDAEVLLAAASTRLATGDVVQVWMDRPGSSKPRPRERHVGDLHLLYEDDQIVVVNKPPGLLTVPLPDEREINSVQELLGEYLRSRGRKRRVFVVHRIDRDTSGLVMFAKDPLSQKRLKDQFRRREPERVYWAVVYGRPDPASGTWRDHLAWDKDALIQKQTHPKDPRAAEAISDYRVLEAFGATSLVEVRLRTGKRNQIRLQARLRGHTLVGEKRYVFGPETIRPVAFPRQALHAQRLALRHPADDRPLAFEAPLPADFAGLLRKLRQARS